MGKWLLAVLAVLLLGQQAGVGAEGAARRPGDAPPRRLKVGKLQRTWRVHVPAALARPAPVVFVFHGGGGSGLQSERQMGFDALADCAGFLAVYPDGYEGNWNDGRRGDFSSAHRKCIDDLAFVRAMLAALAAEFAVDQDRIYATGVSNGGFMSHWVGAKLADRFAAIAPLIGGIGEELAESFSPAAPVSVLIVQGVDDPLVPYHGGIVRLPFGRTRGRLIDTDLAAAMWAAADGCASAPGAEEELPDADPDDGCRLVRTTWTGGRQGSEVVLLRVEGGGHTWPGGPQYLPPALIGRVCRDAGVSLVWEFLQAHPRPAAGGIVPPARRPGALLWWLLAAALLSR